jgi:hypothetical protein
MQPLADSMSAVGSLYLDRARVHELLLFGLQVGVEVIRGFLFVSVLVFIFLLLFFLVFGTVLEVSAAAAAICTVGVAQRGEGRMVECGGRRRGTRV